MRILPKRKGNAWDNMADDSLLLEDFPPGQPDAILFRHYGWTKPAFTFGYSQSYGDIRKTTAPAAAQVCRRSTGGGLVDHRNDWTYSLVLPPSHPLHRAAPKEVYRLAHEVMAAALEASNQPAAVFTETADSRPDAGPAAICFSRPEAGDTVHPVTGRKIAGAALKRNRRGLLLQGSVDRAAAPETDWASFPEIFADRLSKELNAKTESVPWPVFSTESEEKTRRLFASSEWNRRR